MIDDEDDCGAISGLNEWHKKKNKEIGQNLHQWRSVDHRFHMP
jgi:hypothetical protein